MQKISTFLKHITVYFLVFSFLVISFSGSYQQRLKSVKAADPVEQGDVNKPICPKSVVATATNSGGVITVNVTWAQPESVTAQPPKVPTSYIIMEKEKATADAAFGASHQAGTIPGSSTSLSFTTTVQPGKIYAFQVGADYEIGNGACVSNTTDIDTTNIDSTHPNVQPTITNRNTQPVTPPVAAGDDCKAKCPKSGVFTILPSIEDAICQMQCTIINWEAGFIGWVVEKVLYPALGL